LGREREVSRLKEEFLASMSHELRTPLNAVLGLSEALQEEVYGPLTQKQGESLQTIWDSGHKLLSMFDDLLDFSRIGAGRFPTQITPVDLRSCLHVVVRSQTRVLSQAGIRLSLDEGEGDAVAMVDMRHVQRILKMLLENAIKFTPRGGQVGMDLRQAEDPSKLEIVVWDTGIGIPSEKLAQLFEPFVQVEGGLSRRYGGTGLGLALTSRLVSLLGAELEVDSAEGEGSRFILRLSREAPTQLEVFADLRCPFCFVLSEWLEEAHLSHLVRWRGVEQRPGLSSEEACSSEMREELEEELERLTHMAPGVHISSPPEISNTRRAMAALEWVRENDPTRAAEARRLLYRSIWREGRNITEWAAVTEVLSDFYLGGLDDESPEIQKVASNTELWRLKGEERIPMLVSRNQAKLWHGLGLRADLLAFVEAQVRTAPGMDEVAGS
jgi:anti-sigma regulatory factor (Ser/Thr protein kinase)/2-hydroxychromene-2-carboxylate isomerase